MHWSRVDRPSLASDRVGSSYREVPSSVLSRSQLHGWTNERGVHGCGSVQYSASLPVHALLGTVAICSDTPVAWSVSGSACRLHASKLARQAAPSSNDGSCEQSSR